MFEFAGYFQAFSYNGVVRKLEVFRPEEGTSSKDSKEFVLLEDLKDHFDLLSVHFEREDGVTLTFARDCNLQRQVSEILIILWSAVYVPERIPACKDSTIYIVPNSNATLELPLTSDSSKTIQQQPPPTYTTAHSNGFTPGNQDVSDTSSIKGSRQSKLFHSLINTPELQNSQDSASAPRSNVRTVQDHNGINRAEIESKEEYQSEFEDQFQKSFTANNNRQEAEGIVIDVLEQHKKTLIRFALILAKAEEILSTSYHFQHGIGPRLFVILPDLRRKWNPTNISVNHFRLFFLCECGTHTPSSKRTNDRVPKLHLADHEGYTLQQPISFIQQYGPYLLVMLEMLKFSVQIDGYVLPGLSTSITPITPLSPHTESSSSLSLDRINKSIAYLEELRMMETSNPTELSEYLKDLKASDGVDIDKSYLGLDENMKLYANMYRMESRSERADWVCRHHHPLEFEHAEFYELESLLSSVGARLDHQRGAITATLTSSSHANQFHSVILRIVGLGFYHLELRMNWDYTSEDLAKLEDLVGKSGIESFNLVTAPSTSTSRKSSLSRSTRSTVLCSSSTADSLSGQNSEDGQPDTMNISGRCSSRSSSVSSHDHHIRRSSSVSSHDRNFSRSDSLSSEPGVVNAKLPDWAYTYHDQQRANKPYEDGRSRHSVESAPYMLPNDLTEADRLDAQHYIVRYMFQGNYNVKLDRNSKLRILDVATGTGVWALEMAHEFPKARVYGIDISPIYPTSESSEVVPPNCFFQLGNILDGLPFPDDYFDFIYQRLLVYALTPAQRRQVNAELLRVLKPSGHVQLIESDGLLYNAGPVTEMINSLSIETASKRNVDPKEVQRLKPGLRRSGFTNVNSFHVALPVGDWGGPLGQLSLQNMHGLATIWLKGEVGRQSEEECEATLAVADKECEEFQSFYKCWLVVGQKPKLKAMSPPPSPLNRQ
ncbi:hypothetical protein BGZ49_008333 [Haplosporangium sp. Z 27]|nr:hypothetical protein BGZ49_008333 [Haplosporangium sp. Z 27]